MYIITSYTKYIIVVNSNNIDIFETYMLYDKIYAIILPWKTKRLDCYMYKLL